jgi:4-diphosphocytidyl-2-C-methyl-D-erythritol kinase
VSGRSARTRAQAKLNLLLRILARERSGYHQLETVFCRLDLADRITVRTGGSARALDCGGPMLPTAGLGPVESNLAYRAALAFAAAAGWPTGFAIEIEKLIPVGGGLGGGSADAGAVLRAMNALAPRPLPDEALLTLAVGLGADVPFLTCDAALALAWGRGERLLALPALSPRDVVLLVPPLSIATKDAYDWLAVARPDDAPLAAALQLGDLRSWSRIAALGVNDFEDVVFPRFPLLATAHASLGAVDGVLTARLAGSGSTLFAVCEENETSAVRRALREMVSGDADHWRALETRTSERVAPIELGD